MQCTTILDIHGIDQNKFTKGCRLGKAPGISLRLRRAFDGGMLAIVGVKSIAGIVFGNSDGIGNHKHRPNSYSGNSLPHHYYTLTWQMRHLVQPTNQFRLNSFC